MKKTPTILLILLMLFPFSAAADMNLQSCSEVEKLIEFVRRSPCKFNRNGSWYASSEAAGHIDKKYHAALDKGLVHSAEDFIKYAATKSSLTGTLYKVQCKGKEINCADWLTAELRKVREKNK